MQEAADMMYIYATYFQASTKRNVIALFYGTLISTHLFWQKTLFLHNYSDIIL
jgi:hypothetical protein